FYSTERGADDSSYGRNGEYTQRGRGALSERTWSEGTGTTASEEGIARNVKEGAGEIASRTKEYASETAESMRRVARRRQNQLQRMVQENPLLVGAGALMLGAAFGLAIPETETENE